MPSADGTYVAENTPATERCLLAVGDDDQNIYQWRGGSNRYIERFCDEYTAQIDYLVENYRSTGAIIAASNRVIEQVPDRLKVAQAIRVNEVRAPAPEGGRWQELDRQRHGAVMRFLLPASDSTSGNCQAQITMAELQRLLSLENADSWQGCAVLARSHRYLRPMQAWCEQYGITYTLGADRQSALPLTRQRGFLQAVDGLRVHHSPTLTVDAANQSLSQLGLDASWLDFFTTALLQAGTDYGDVAVSHATLINNLYDYARECRQASSTGLYLGTVHSAKGLEFRHVVVADGSWQQTDAARDEELRLYYVAMTRAQETLTLCEFEPGNNLIRVLGEGTGDNEYRVLSAGSGETDNQVHDQTISTAVFNPADAAHIFGGIARTAVQGTETIITQVFTGSPDPTLDIQYQTLRLKDIDIGYAGRKSSNHSIHTAIAGIKPGDPLQLRADLQNRYLISTVSGDIIGRTSASYRLELDDITASVAGIVVRFSSDMERQSVGKPLCRRWEVVVPQIKGRPRRDARM
jgi:ATP-dependent DNA helicase RecQ